MFDPHQHLIQLPRRVKDPETGRYVTTYDAYLEVRWRVVMFREKYPHGVITTDEICVDLDRGYARYKATVEDGEGGKATGYGTETKADFTDFAERAETRALGRALAVLGFGTQFVGQDLTEGEHVADAPVTHAHHDMPAPTNGQAPSPLPSSVPTDRPTEAHITALHTLAVVECREDPEVFGQRLRTIMGLKPSASVAPKLLTRTMTMVQYMEAMQYYQRLLAQLNRQTIPEASHDTQAQDTPVAEPAQLPTTEAPDAVPFSSISAHARDHAEADGETITHTTTGNGPGPKDPEGCATPAQIAVLKRLAARVGADTAEDLQDVLDHSPRGLLMDVYQRIETRLQARLNGKKAPAVA